MRLRGQITIRYAKPITTDIISVCFIYNGDKYVWKTRSWKSGKNEIPYSNTGDKFNVSFTTQDGSNEVKNLRVL